MSDKNALPALKVGILPRVIAAGMERRNGKWVGFATLSLMPWTDSKEFARSVELSQWPAQIDGLLKEARLFISPIKKGSDVAIESVACSTVQPGVALRPSARFSPAYRDSANDLWAELVAGGDPNAWGYLIKALKDSQQGSSLGQLACRPTGAGAGGEMPVDSAADNAKKLDPPSDVIAYPRADAALLYGFQRAREVLRAMRRERAQCHVGKCVIKTGGRFLDVTHFSFDQKPWLGLDRRPPVRFAQATQSDAPTLGSLQGFAERDKLLAQERMEQEARYQSQLTQQSRQAKKQHTQRNSYLGSTSVSDRVKALQTHAKERATSLAPSECADACGPASDDAVNAATDKVKAAHGLGSLPDVDELGNPILTPQALNDAFDITIGQAQQRLFAILAMPSLARLFNLVVDMEFDLEELEKELGSDEKTLFGDTAGIDHWGNLTGKDEVKKVPHLDAQYMLLTTNLGRSDFTDGAPDSIGGFDPPRVWTYAKSRRPGQDADKREPGHFWPCSREELDIQLHASLPGGSLTTIRESCAVFQYDGVVDLGVVYCPDGVTRNPRYDIVCLDTIQTVESDIQSDRRLQQQAAMAAKNQLPSTSLGVQTRRTGGLALIDRWRQDQAVSQIATAQFHLNKGGEIILDAEDMTTAYRLDVGVDVSADKDEPNIVWRSLMNRKLIFGSKRSGTEWIEGVVASLYDWGGAKGDKNAVERRRRADGASLSIASRLRQNAAQRQGSGASTAFVEQIMIAWHGDPLGVDCLDPHGSSGVIEEPKGMSMPATGLLLDISYDLEDSKEDYRPPSLRYGWPYHLGLRPVYLGGVILPIESAVPRYEKNFGTGSALPSSTERHGRRFLRHERIEAPALTVPEGIVSKVTDEIRALDAASISTGASCILRTWKIGSPRHEEPASTVRILFPPIMQLDKAVLHGVFDNDAGETIKIPGGTLINDQGKRVTVKERTLQRPRDGLKLLDFGGDRGDAAGQIGGFPHFISTKNKDKNPRGPAVFRLLGNGLDRKIPFYPDPAAAYYIIAARRTNSDDDYLLGDPIKVPICESGARYPNITPLAIEIRKAARRTKPVQKIEELFPSGAVLARADKSGVITGEGGGGLPVRHLVASLPPGEDFEIDVWCVPDSRTLLGKFDIVESVSVLLMRDSAVENFADGEPNLACLSGLERYFPGAGQQIRDALEKGKWPHRLNPLCGPGGIALPQSMVMKKVADAIFNALCSRPIPELAAVTSIHAVHAVDIPLERPQFVLGSGVGGHPEFARLGSITFDKLMSQQELDSYSNACPSPRQDWSEISDDGATNAIIRADITVDLLTTSDFELRARMVSPVSAVFDDVNRGRTAEEKARGAFRPVGWLPQINVATAWPRLTAEAVAPASTQLFGFDVSAEGYVDLPSYWAPLIKFHNLPDAALCERNSNIRPVNLLSEQQQAVRSNPPNKLGDDVAITGQGTRVQYVQPFRDGLARKLELQLVATSRFSNLFPGDENTPKREQTSDHFYAWLPATKRPDPISAKSLRPSFTWVHDTQARFVPAISGLTEARSVTTAVRTCSIHLPFDRPHFTSGEGERVGIVIWPPDLMLGAKPGDIENDCVRRSEQEGQTIRLGDTFSDSDLGPGGDYVTRWGADPIREGPRPKGWLMPAKAFSDCSNPDVEFEANVLMPIPRKPDASLAAAAGKKTDSGASAKDAGDTDDVNKESNNQESGDTAGREFMLVSLLTYEPRFDIDYERWYIDVRIDADQVPEPFIRLGLVRFQKHAKQDLQVSEPIAEWVQVMPKRAVSVSVAPPDARSERTELTVEVSSPAAYDGSAPLFDPGSDHPSAPGSAPFMRAYLLREDLLSGSGSVQTIVPPEEAFNTLSTQLLPQRTPAGTVWGASIGFVCTDLGSLAASSYSVFIEEVEAYRSTADPFDDLTGVAAPSVMESGPRFAAIVPITIPQPVAKPTAHASVPPAVKKAAHVKHTKPTSSQEYRP